MRKQMIALAALCPLTVFAVSPVHNRVIDYVPAPGQFVNELPEWEDGDDSEAMAAKALQYMTEEGYYISLGAWGGYVTVGFERTIVNVPGKRDIYIEGNAFQSSQSSTKGGNSEPGVVMVAYDINHNGIPDGMSGLRLPEVNIRNQSTIMRSHIFARLLTRKILCGWTIRETADL